MYTPFVPIMISYISRFLMVIIHHPSIADPSCHENWALQRLQGLQAPKLSEAEKSMEKFVPAK